MKFLCVKASAAKAVAEPFPYPTVYVDYVGGKRHS